MNSSRALEHRPVQLTNAYPMVLQSCLDCCPKAGYLQCIKTEHITRIEDIWAICGRDRYINIHTCSWMSPLIMIVKPSSFGHSSCGRINLPSLAPSKISCTAYDRLKSPPDVPSKTCTSGVRFQSLRRRDQKSSALLVGKTTNWKSPRWLSWVSPSACTGCTTSESLECSCSSSSTVVQPVHGNGLNWFCALFQK